MRNNEERILGIKKTESASPVSNSSLSFVVPTEYVDLPSQGRFYPVGHPLRGQKSIEIKQMTAKEEDILVTESYIKKGVTLDKLLESIIIDKSINPDTLCTADRSAIYLAARISAYGPEYKSSVGCDKCGETIKINYNLIEEPKVIQAKEDLEVTENGTFMIKLPTTGWDIECKLLNGLDEKNSFNDKESNENIILKQLESIIVSINTVSDKQLIKQAFEVLPVKDSRYLRTTFRELCPALKFNCELKCKCGNKEEAEVPVTLEFFWPK